MTENTKRAVVIHVMDAPQDMERAVRTSHALRESLPDVRIRIVVNGPALTAVPAAVTAHELPENVGVAVCALGLRNHRIAESDLPDGVEIVPKAPIIIVEEQLNGAAYLRL